MVARVSLLSLNAFNRELEKKPAAAGFFFEQISNHELQLSYPLHKGELMRLLLALLLPWLQFFTIGRPFAGIICLILQLTLIGWIPAAIWSVYALSQYKTDQKIKQAMGASE